MHDEFLFQQNPRLRAILAILPAILACASLVLLVTTPLAWGAWEAIDAPAWMPAAVHALVAVAGLSIGLYALRSVWRATRGRFDVARIQLALGLLMLAIGTMMVLALLMTVGDAQTYEDALVQQRPDGTIARVSATAAFLGGLVYAATMSAAA